jgi:AraC family transcriptional regulator
MLATWMYETRPFAPCRGNALLDQLLAALLYAYSGDDEQSDDAMIGRVKRHVQENLAGNLSLDALAAVACASRFHFARRFKRCTGVSPMKFVRSARLEAARNLLLTTDLPHRRVAAQVGLVDQCQLARIFRRETGLPPSQLRKTSELPR